MTASCPTCRAELPEGARFCPGCGAAVELDRAEATERKVVTTLFADLVGFTALGERHDPEDVDAALRGYYALASEIVERFGGVVEKFIGDAVVGLFGVPAAHEDDAERAVRVALELVARMRELPPVGSERLRVRAAVNTGPALVRLRAIAGAGEGVLVGDAVNTAARLLSQAPPMSVVVGERTHSLSAHAIDYQTLGRLKVRGKQDTVEAWLAVAPVARRGVDLARAFTAPMVGREVEMGILRGMLARARANSRPQLALVSGEAGAGKSRLVFELAQWVDHEPGLIVNWREGRCLPYGEGSGFQPLADVVRAHAGITDTDDESAAAAKLDRAVPAGPDHGWIVDRLRPLVGLSAHSAEQQENFAAWARFLDDVAQERPTVVFLDDLHWADDGLLAFLAHIVQHGLGAPLLLLGACRPEFFELHPDVPGYLGAATGDDTPVTRIDLASLSPAETERLVDELSPGVSPDVRTVIVDRSGGNPFYTEELVRLLRTGDGRAASAWLTFESLPDSLQALLTARLDALDADHKAVLSDAAVAGQMFSPELVAAMGGRAPEEVRRMLDELSAREFVRVAPDDSPDAAGRFVFWHALTRDAAYSQLTRGARAEKHAVAADLLGRSHGERHETVGTIADHRIAALELASAAGLTDLASTQHALAVDALMLAGDQVVELDAAAAETRYRKAAALVSRDDPRRPLVLHHWANTLLHRADFDACIRVFREALALLEKEGDVRRLAVAASDFAPALELVGETEAAIDLYRTWVPPLEEEGPSPEVLSTLTSWLGMCTVMGDVAGGQAIAQRLLEVARELGEPEPLEAILFRAYRRGLNGDRRGLDDYRAALDRAMHENDSRKTGVIYYNFAADLAPFDGPSASLALQREGLSFCTRRRHRAISYSLRYGIAHDLYYSGAWEAARDEISALDPLLKSAGNLAELAYLRALATVLACSTGRATETHVSCDELVATGHGTSEANLRSWALVAGAALLNARGDQSGCAQLLRDCFDLPDLVNEGGFDWPLAEVARLAAASNDDRLVTRAEEWARSSRPLSPCVAPATAAVAAEYEGRFDAARDLYEEAGRCWSRLGVPYESALASLGAARCGIGRDPDAAARRLREAEDTFVRLGAGPALAEARRLLSVRQP